MINFSLNIPIFINSAPYISKAILSIILILNFKGRDLLYLLISIKLFSENVEIN